ncbi:uncharacterized protein METZ01_LOCUS487585, partial [marine metagenome]
NRRDRQCGRLQRTHESLSGQKKYGKYLPPMLADQRLPVDHTEAETRPTSL